jgi:response regulator RpfG family c-di-GMP phosphodiesterase
MLIVEDGTASSLDLLYRNFRRKYKVLRAESGPAALEILAREGEVAVIICDEPTPKMSVTEFLRLTAVQYPDTSQIMLISYTEHFFEAIDAGQLCHYIAKPWNPEELSVFVTRLVDTYTLRKARTNELRQRGESAEQARQAGFQAIRDAIPRLLGMGLSAEQVAEALSLSVEEVRQNAGE